MTGRFWLEKLVLFLLILPNSAWSSSVAERLDKSYIPEMTVSESPAGYSFNLCKLTDLTLNVVDPVTLQPGFVKARVYSARSNESLAPNRSVILLPPTGGENVLDRVYSNALCKAGFKVVLLQTWFQQTEAKIDFSMHDEGAVRSLSAIRHVLDYLKPADRNQVGILGTSVGALSSSLALGYDARLNVGVMIVGGFGQAEIIARSTEEGAAKLREQRMKAFGYSTIEEYVAAVSENVKIDPKDFVNHSGPKKVLAFVGTEDITVPTKNQRELVTLFGAESVEYKGDHLETIKNTAFRQTKRIVEFFSKNLR